jgi:murein DD-endopeptidase MepM/ murein hydrolase activator NlpD
VRIYALLFAFLFLAGGNVQSEPWFTDQSGQKAVDEVPRLSSLEGWQQATLGDPGSFERKWRESHITAYLERIEREEPYVWPVDGHRIISHWGNRRNWESRVDIIASLRKNYRHLGLDIDGDMGDSIRSSCSGVVVLAGWKNGYGCSVKVRCYEGGETLLYGHMYDPRECSSPKRYPEFMVQAGQRVSRGQEIGEIGNSGSSLGSHLHVTAWRDGVNVDPCGILPCDTRMDGIADGH